MSDDWQLAAAPLATSLRMYVSYDHRVGMRSGMMDAATLCDLISREILASGRPSKQRRAAAAVALRCGDAIEAMRAEVAVDDPLATPTMTRRIET